MVDVAGPGLAIGDAQFYGFQAPEGIAPDHLRELVLSVRGKAGNDRSVVVVGASVDGPKVSLVAAVNETGQRAGWLAKDMLAAALPAVGGRGGGKADVAQGGGSDPAGVPQALSAVQAVLGGK